MKQKGFTFIELMIAISITAVLGTLGIAGFVNYNQIQVLQTSANDVVTMLNLAKSRAQAQIKPLELCSGTRTLEGYEVKIGLGGKYALHLRCSGLTIKVSEQDKNLPSGLSFTPSAASFFFPVQTGGVETPGQIVVSNADGRIRVITLNSLGRISMQSSMPTPTPTSTPTPTPTSTPGPTPTRTPTPTPTPTPVAPPPDRLFEVTIGVFLDLNGSGGYYGQSLLTNVAVQIDTCDYSWNSVNGGWDIGQCTYFAKQTIPTYAWAPYFAFINLCGTLSTRVPSNMYSLYPVRLTAVDLPAGYQSGTPLTFWVGYSGPQTIPICPSGLYYIGAEPL